MDSVVPQDAARRRRRSTVAGKGSLRVLRHQLSLLNPHVRAPLAHRAGLHPASGTGTLDRLQRGGWVVRERDPEASDRRAVTVRAVRGRNAELFRLYSGMNGAMDQICSEYTEAELELLADFLRRTTAAGRH